MKHCSHCPSILAAGAYFCSQCGFISSNGVQKNLLECENHSDQIAIAVCIVCGKPVCGDCAIAKDKKFFCDSGEHINIDGEYVVIYSCESEFEADMIRQNLHQAGIRSLSFSFHNHVGTYWNQDRALVQLRVSQSQAHQATDILRNLGLLNNIDESHLNN
ncbi:MAG: hypothetical protein HY088_02170 [Ignavibacteriales bacterium]|nr:hypothetical protein [Ignavibacteriales bacterium]